MTATNLHLRGGEAEQPALRLEGQPRARVNVAVAELGLCRRDAAGLLWRHTRVNAVEFVVAAARHPVPAGRLLDGDVAAVLLGRDERGRARRREGGVEAGQGHRANLG